MSSTGKAFAELGLRPDATEVEVKAAWRRLVSHWHPDRNASASAVEKIQRINQAYRAILRAARVADDAQHSDADDEDDRAEPDSHPEPPAPADSPPPAGTTRRSVDRTVRLTLEEASAGCTKVLQGKLVETCLTCAGGGEQVPPPACPACAGSGAQRQRSWFGWPAASAICAACGGSGCITLVCGTCLGAGKLALGKYRIAVRIPHGARDGDLLHVDGSRASGESPVDLEIRIEVAPHALFTLADDGTLRNEVPVDGFVWVTNRAIKVPTLDGVQQLQLSRDRLSYVLPGRGFPTHRRGPRADHVIDVRPIFPESFSTDQNILLDQLIATRVPAGDASDSAGDRLGAWDAAVRAWECSRSGDADAG